MIWNPDTLTMPPEQQLEAIEGRIQSYSKDFRVQETHRFSSQWDRVEGFPGWKKVPARRWIQAHVKVLHKDNRQGIVFLAPNTGQRRLEAARLWMIRHDYPVRIVILKPRRIGFSTYVEALAFEHCVRGREKHAQVIAHRKDISRKVLSMMKRMVKHLCRLDGTPWQLDVAGSRHEIRFGDPINSTIDTDSAEVEEPGHGDTSTFLHLTETSRWKDAERKAKGLLSTVAKYPGTEIYNESTANGDVGWYRNLFWDAWNAQQDGHLDESGNIAVFVAWWEHEEYRWSQTSGQGKFLPGYLPDDMLEQLRDTLTDDETELIERHGVDFDQLWWRRQTCKQDLGGIWDEFMEQYPASPEEAFQISGRPYFDIERLRALERSLPKPIMRGTLVDLDNTQPFVPMRPEPNKNPLVDRATRRPSWARSSEK